MGDRLVKRAMLFAWPTLKSDRARIVLAAMAHHAMDSDARPRYFGGWEALAIPLGYPEPTETARRAVTRAVEELRSRGYISQDYTTSRTWKRRWWITLPGP